MLESLTDALTISVFPRAAYVRPSLWIRGPVWDTIVVQNALWLVPLVLWLGHAGPQARALDTFYFTITALFWIGHRFTSAWLAYGTQAYRPLLKAQPGRNARPSPIFASGATSTCACLRSGRLS